MFMTKRLKMNPCHGHGHREGRGGGPEHLLHYFRSKKDSFLFLLHSYFRRLSELMAHNSLRLRETLEEGGNSLLA